MRLFCPTPRPLTISPSLYISILWTYDLKWEEGMGWGLYDGRQVWGQRQGYGSRLHLCRAPIQRAPSGKSTLQPHTAALVELWVPDATSWWGHQLFLAMGHHAALGTPQLSDLLLLSSCEIMLFHASEIILRPGTICVGLFIHLFIHFLPWTLMESKLGC